MSTTHHETTDEKETGRVEAFSDGVFAIAITLLVLELRVPHGADSDSLQELAGQGPAFFAFFTGFATIGIMWLNHHRVFNLVRRVDHGLLLWNTLLLLGTTLVPFFMHLVSVSLGHRGDRVAAALFSANGVLTAFGYNALWHHITHPKGRPLLRVPADDPRVLEITSAYRFGAVYVIGIVVAIWNAWASVGINLALALFFALPPRRSR